MAHAAFFIQNMAMKIVGCTGNRKVTHIATLLPRMFFYSLLFIIFLFAIIPLIDGGKGGAFYHFSTFLVLGIAARLIFRTSGYITYFLLLLFGTLIEVVQMALPYGRTGDILDLLIDAIAIATGMLLAVRMRQWVSGTNREG